MDQNAMVSEQTESGKRLISTLSEAGLLIQVAFWAKPTEEGKWFLYLATPTVDTAGPAATYRLVYSILRECPELRIEPLEIRVVGLNDSLTKAALEAIKPKIPNSPYAVRNPKPFPGITWYRGDSLGGVSIDGAYIYPPPYSCVSA